MEIQQPQISKMPTTSETIKADFQGDAFKEPPSWAEIQAWIVSYLAQLLEMNPDEINTTIPFDQYGLDSSAAVGMTGDLEDWIGKKIDPTLVYDYPTIEALAQHLANESK
ncbi:MAG TPA: acyl carrier protein [Waterburya sp.]|jgi:acyl carrier protein